MDIRSILLVIFLMGSTQASYTQSLPFDDEKYSLGAGIGFDYGVLGLGGKYFPKKNLGIVVSAPFWNIGLEVNLPYVIKERLVPYLSIRYGINTKVRVYNNTNPSTPVTARERQSYNGFVYGIGFKLKSPKNYRRYLTASINYIDRTSAASEFIKEYNLEQGTSFNSEIGDSIRPSLGLVFYFNGKKN